MKAVLTCLLSAALLFSGCLNPKGKDNTISVSGDDPEMNAAISNARNTLPRFWTIHQAQPEDTDFALKVRITDSGKVEHFWCVDIERTRDGIFGTIDNDPEIVRSVTNGQRIRIPEADISDWMYIVDNQIHGNYTLRVLLKQMPKEEAEVYRAMLAED